MKNNYRRYYVLPLSFALLWALSTTLTSQNGSPPIAGIITDANGPLGGVNIIVKNSSRGTQSDIEGHYEITANTRDTLLFSYVGFKTQEIVVGSNSILNVLMQPDATSLDQVVINAGYYKVSEKERTGSIAKITAKEIENQPVANPLEALQGRMPGLTVAPTTGLPGGGFQVRIRGQNSLAAGNDPLFIIDGIPYDSQSLSGGYASGPLLPDGNVSPINSISPSNIESIEVLKDADATAIYGSRGANGVVLITTKKGKMGKPKYNVKMQTSLGQVAHFQKLLNTQEYLNMRKEAFLNDGIEEFPEYEYDISTWDKNRYTNWQKELIGNTAYRQNISADASGGNENIQFRLGGEYLTETTVFPKDYRFNRLAINSSLHHKNKTDRLEIQFNAHYSIENNNLPSADLTLPSQNLPPNAPALYDNDGNLNWEEGTFENPLSSLEGAYLLNRKTLLADLGLHYKILPTLSIRLNTGYVSSKLEESLSYPHTIYNPFYGLGPEASTIFINNGNRSSWIVEPQLEYNFNLLAGKISLLAGASVQQKTESVLSYFGQGFASNELLYNLAAASLIGIEKDQTSEYKYEAVYGRLNYILKNRYILNLTGRRDGSSRFGATRKFSNFGAIGLAWLFNDESFLKNAQWLYLGKLRASYGRTGNDQIGDYKYLDTYTISGTPYGGTIGIGPTQLFNPDFGWEINKKLTLGIDLAFIKNRISLTAEWYKNRSSNQLVLIPLPATTGFPSIQSNLGAIVENRGWEFNLQTINYKNEYFNWSTNFNLSLPKNELIAFPDLESSTYANKYVIGKPITVQKLYHYIGINPETGVYQFEDYNGDGEISAPEDQQFTEDLSPKFYGGIQNNFNYKNLQLSFFFQFSKQKAYNQWYIGSPAGIMVNQPIQVLDHWQNPGDNSATQIYTSGSNIEATTAFYNFMQSDAAISDASFIRLKNISLSYDLPLNQLEVKIFLQAQNLLTFTKFKGNDPEQTIGYVPPLRWIGGGFQLTL